METIETLLKALPHALDTVDVPGWGEKFSGKVRDTYRKNGRLLLITSDRVSAFDRVLGLIPFKGQVLNQLSAWWFAQLEDIVPNHLLSVPDPNVTVAVEAQPLPVEVIVRGYITGVTKTSLWTLYDAGERRPYGIPLPDGLQKNDPLPEPLITPTTKAKKGHHDERLTQEQARALLPDYWDEVAQAAVAIFKRGQEIAAKAGLILVDTKYEFGLVNGRVTLIDEVHTPDSSRYWIAGTYRQGTEPENFDKEFLRIWFAGQGYRGEGIPPQMPPEFVAQVAARYIAAFERLTGQEFKPGAQPGKTRIAKAANRMLRPLVPILMGSRSDMEHAQKIASALESFAVDYDLRIGSAHKVPERVLEILQAYEADPRPKVYITIAGRSNALSGFADAQVSSPVIACPPVSSSFGGADIYSSLRMPSGVAPAVVLEPAGAALLAAKILGLSFPEIRDKVASLQAANREKLLADDDAAGYKNNVTGSL